MKEYRPGEELIQEVIETKVAWEAFLAEAAAILARDDIPEEWKDQVRAMIEAGRQKAREAAAELRKAAQAQGN